MKMTSLKTPLTRIVWMAMLLLAPCQLCLSQTALAVTHKAQELCPIQGEKINRKVFTDYKGKRIYFCCAMCIDAFLKDPEKFIKDFETKGIDLEDTPVK